MMRRAECAAPGTPLTMVDLPIPDAPEKGLVVKTVYSGVCHSDIHLQDGHFNMGGGNKFETSSLPGVTWPQVFGHEISGVVHSIGRGAANSGLRVGDRVVVYPWIGCTECSVCLNDRATICETTMTFIGGIHPGGFSTHVSVPLAKFAVKVPDDIPMDVAALSACSGLTTYNAVTTVRPKILDMTKLKGSSSLLIIGSGGLGCWTYKLARALLPKTTKVYVADITIEKLKLAQKNGADEVVVWDVNGDETSLVKVTKEKTGGGVDAVIDLVGNGVTNARDLNVLNRGGILVCIGLFGGHFSISTPNMVFNTPTITGVFVGTMAHLKGLTETIAENQMVPVPITHYPLDDVPRVIDMLRDGKITGRAVLKFPE